MRICKVSMLLSFVAIPLSVLMFYGLEDKNADYFKKGKFITNTEGWEYKYNKVIYHYGMMVSHWSVIVVVSICIGMISWICHEGYMAVVVVKHDRKRI